MSADPRDVRLRRPAGLDDMLLYRLNRIRAVAGGVVLRLCEGQFGVTRREWVLLALLGGDGPVSPSGLAARADLNKSATSKAVVTLVAKGLVRRSPRSSDRRFADLELTPRGQALFDRMMPVMKGINASLLGALSDEEAGLLDAILDRLQAAANDLSNTSAPLPLADRRRGPAASRIAIQAEATETPKASARRADRPDSERR